MRDSALPGDHRPGGHQAAGAAVTRAAAAAAGVAAAAVYPADTQVQLCTYVGIAVDCSNGCLAALALPD